MLLCYNLIKKKLKLSNKFQKSSYIVTLLGLGAGVVVVVEVVVEVVVVITGSGATLGIQAYVVHA